MKGIAGTWLCFIMLTANAQFINQLAIPPALTGTTFNLNIQNGITQFWAGINTPTYGINGNILGPTLIVNKWDSITLTVTNSLTGFGNSTTIHWHGLHVPAMYDGGPHQVILQAATWSPHFRMLNNAGTYWYHPHGDNKTDLHVSKGIAGMIIVKDSAEAALNLPRTYGTDDFPIIVQSKAFDILHQIAIATEEDTLMMVNGTPHAYLNAPAQVVRMRLLNGSSSRSYNFGFTASHSFKMIASDGGLLENAITLTRILLSPGERAEILLDLQGEQGDTVFLMAFNSELPNGIYGAATVTGMMGGNIPGYQLNPLNGSDFGILQINVVAQSSNPVTSLPTSLVAQSPFSNYTTTRTFTFSPDTMMSAVGQVAGPFNINGAHFDMNTINVTTYLNNGEKWHIKNNTGIAHPFHIHDVQFNILNVNGGTVPEYLKGKKDVVLVMPQQYVEIVTRFEDFADDNIPYMYHCHLLHHEDDGMMGSFRVMDTTNNGISALSLGIDGLKIYPNPASETLNITIPSTEKYSVEIFNILGEMVLSSAYNIQHSVLFIQQLQIGLYFVRVKTDKAISTQKLVKQ